MFENKDRIKNYIAIESKKSGISLNDGYNYLFSRYFIDRIYKKNCSFTLSGSFGRFANLGIINRPLTDIDIETNISFDDAKNYIDSCLCQYTSLPINYSLKKFFRTENNTIDTVIEGELEGIKQTIRLDIAFSKEPSSITLNLPKLFSQDQQTLVKTKSLDDLIASKIFALFIKLLLFQNTKTSYIRYKDFFDYYYIINNIPFDKEKVKALFQKKVQESKFVNGLANSVYDMNMLNTKFIERKKSQFDEAKKKYSINDNTPYDIIVDTINEEIKRNL